MDFEDIQNKRRKLELGMKELDSILKQREEQLNRLRIDEVFYIFRRVLKISICVFSYNPGKIVVGDQNGNSFECTENKIVYTLLGSKFAEIIPRATIGVTVMFSALGVNVDFGPGYVSHTQYLKNIVDWCCSEPGQITKLYNMLNTTWTSDRAIRRKCVLLILVTQAHKESPFKRIGKNVTQIICQMVLDQ
jgi:hypothetical protein